MRRWMTGIGLFWAVFAAGGSVATASPPVLALVDDRDQALAEGAVEVCFRQELERRCGEAGSGGRWSWPGGFGVAEIQGPEHGPVRVEAAELQVDSQGIARVVVPRKARLRIRAASRTEPVTLSLYGLDDEAFRLPVYRFEVTAGEEVRAPAGEYLASVTPRGAAPDLHEVDLAPGARETIVTSERAGWSLVVRAVAASTGEPIAGVAVAARPLELETENAAPARFQDQTNARGLVLLSGIEATYLTVTARHARFVATESRGVSSSPGTFAVRELPMRPGGTVRVDLRDGEGPAAGARVELLELAQQPGAGRRSPKVEAAGETGIDGSWQAARVPAGTYTVRIHPGEEASHLDREVIVADGEESGVAVKLEPVDVQGTVYRGSTSAGKGYQVEMSAIEAGLSGGAIAEPVAEAVTDEEGSFEARVWEAGSYEVMLLSPAYVPVSRRRVELFGDEEEIDFYVEEGAVAGQVVDEEGRGVESAMVLMTWNDSKHLSVGTLEEGYFSLPVDSAGTARVEARKSGYEGSEVTVVEVSEGIEPAPITLTLRRAPGISGRVEGGDGRAASGVTVVSFGEGPGEGRFLGASESGPAGEFELPRAPRGGTRIFAQGLDCPLIVADVSGEPEEGPVLLQCPTAPATLDIQVVDGSGAPARGEFVRLRRDGVVIPEGLLKGYLSRLGLPVESDGQGRLVLPSLAPGRYELFLESASSPTSVAAGADAGFVTSVEIGAFATTELEVVVERPGS